VMMMLGDLSWKLPAALERLLPHVRVEGETARQPRPHDGRRGELPDAALPEPAG
jgi:hypothetical protein